MEDAMKTKTNLQSFFKTISIAVILMLMFSQFGSQVANASTNEANPLNTTLSPNIHANAGDDWVEGYEWPSGALATITLHDPTAPAGTQDYTTSVTIGPSTSGSGASNFHVDLNGIYDIRPGCQVSVSVGDSDGGYNKRLTVTNLAVARIDLAGNSVSGTTDPAPSAHLWIFVYDTSAADMSPTFDIDGSWTANFSSIPYTLLPGISGRVEQFDNDGDVTDVDWRILNPHLEVRLKINPSIHARDWPLNSILTLTVVDPFTPQNYTLTATMVADLWGQPGADLILPAGLTLQPGFILNTSGVTPSGDVITSSYTLPNLSVFIDVENDIITGHATPLANLWICANSDNMCSGHRNLSVPLSGDYSADFTAAGTTPDNQSTYDIQPGASGWVTEFDSPYALNGNWTQYNWHVPNPNIQADLSDNWVMAHDWAEGLHLTLTIYDPGSSKTYPPVDAIATPAGWNPGDIIAFFAPLGVQLQAGYVLTVAPQGGGTPSKSYTIANLQATPDAMNNTVSGIATPGARVWVCRYTPNNCINRWVNADATGKWLVRYSSVDDPQDDRTIYTLKPGDTGWALEYDASGNQTQYDWNVPSSIPFVHSEFGQGNGGTLATTNGMASLTVPSTAVPADSGSIDFSITTGDSNYEVDVSQGALLVVNSYSIQPHGTVFNSPATLTFHWDDADNNGIVDGTYLMDVNLVLIKDGVVITPACGANSPACNRDTNTLTVLVDSLSVFELAAPLDSDGDGLPDNVDACPTQNPHGLDADQDGCTDTAAGLRNLVASAPASVIAGTTQKSLLAKVDAAISSLNKGNKKAAAGQLQLFINDVQAQRGKKIAISTADMLIAYARNVIVGVP
jgi:hypothetical protein